MFWNRFRIGYQVDTQTLRPDYACRQKGAYLAKQVGGKLHEAAKLIGFEFRIAGV